MAKDIWIHGESIDGEREFMVRLVAPRCVIRIGCNDELDFDDHSIDDGAGQSLTSPLDEEFCVISWIDPRPDDETILSVLREAATFNEMYTQDAFVEGQSETISAISEK